MEQPRLVLPRLLPIRQERPPQETIPQTRLERDRIKAVVQSYVAELKPVPPMPVDDLRMHADAVVEGAGLQEKYRDYVAVLLNNEAWRDTLAGIPYERRLLMLPKCLRVEAKCPAPFDEFGLLCKHCGLCSIEDLQDEAERLGYAVLVAEGSALVTAIIQTGKIDAIVGVSCLSVLEKARQLTPTIASAVSLSSRKRSRSWKRPRFRASRSPSCRTTASRTERQ